MYYNKADTITRLATECLTNERMLKIISQCVIFNEEPDDGISLTIVVSRNIKSDESYGWWGSFYGRHIGKISAKTFRYKYYKLHHRITIDEFIKFVNQPNEKYIFCVQDIDIDFFTSIVERRVELRQKLTVSRKSSNTHSILNSIFR